MKLFLLVMSLVSISWTTFASPGEPSDKMKDAIQVYQELIDKGWFHAIDPSPSWYDGKTQCNSRRVRFESKDPQAFLRIDENWETFAGNLIFIEEGTHLYTLVEFGHEYTIKVRADGRWGGYFDYCRLRFPESK